MLIGAIAEELLIQFAFAEPLAEPLAALDMVDAGPGSLLVEAPTFADAVVDAGLVYGVTINEVATAADGPAATVIILITGSVSEPASAGSAQDATVLAAIAATAAIADEIVTPALASVTLVGSGMLLTVP